MKKLIGAMIVGLALLILLSFMPTNTLENEVSISGDNSYLTLVPAKPPKTPPKK